MTELMELFLTGPSPIMNEPNLVPISPNFATEFTKFVDKNSMLKPATDSNFFTMFFVSSLLTLPYSRLMDRNFILHVHFKIDAANLIKIVYPRLVDQNIIMEFRTVLFGSNVVINSQQHSAGKHGFTIDEIREIVNLYHLDVDTFGGVKFRWKIFQMCQSMKIFWTEVSPEPIRRIFESAILTADAPKEFQTFIQLNNVLDESQSLLLDPFRLLNTARTPQQIKDISIHLMSNLRLLYSMNMHIMPKHFARTSELFSAFACGTMVMNVQNRFQQTIYVHNPTGYMHLLTLIPQIDATVNLHTPISLAFVDNNEHFKATIELVNSPAHNLMWSSPLTNSKLAVITLSNFNRLYDDASIAASLLNVNRPLLPKLVNNMEYLFGSLTKENLESFLFSEVQCMFRHLGSRDFNIVSNYMIGQMSSLQHINQAIDEMYVFTYKEYALRNNVRTFVFTTDDFAFAVNIIRDRFMAPTTIKLWESKNRRLVPMHEDGKFTVSSKVWKNKMIHLNIDVKTGEILISKKGGEGQIHKNTGIVRKLARFTPKKFILSAGHVTANLEISKLITPLYSYLTTSDELVVFLAGLFSEEYACLSTTASDSRRMLFLFNIDSNTVIDHQKISQEIQNQLTKDSATVVSSLIETLNVRINVFSSLFDPELLIRKPVPAMAIDFILPLELSTSNQVNVELRKTFHNGESLEHLLLMEPMSRQMPDDCFLEGQRFKRSWMGKCLFEEKSPGKILALLEQQINEKDQQSKRPVNPKKFYGLLTKNQKKLFEHVINYHKNQLWTFLDRTRMIQKLNNIYMISNAVTLGIIYKNIAADLYRGDYAGAMFGAAFLGGNYLISEGFTFLAERKYLQNSKTLGFMSPVLRRSAPFLRRFAAGYNLYSLYKSSVSYSKNGDTTSLVNIIESSTFLAVDVAEISMELAGAEALLGIFGPVGAAVAALVFIGTEIYQVHEKLKPYDEVLHLSMVDKVLDGAYTFFTGEMDSGIRDMANEKQINEYLAISASEYMSNHTEIFAYIFPIYISINGKTLIADNNVINLDKEENIKWPSVLPDKQKMSCGTEILCFTSSETEWSDHSKDATLFDKFKYHWDSFLELMGGKIKKEKTLYRCDNALGLSNKKVKKGKIVIDLQNGDDTVNGFNRNEHVFIIGNGKKTIKSRSDDLSTFLFVGNLTTGSIFSQSNGSGIADFTNYAQNLMQPLVIKTNNKRTIIYTYNNSQLSLDNVFNILGRKDKPDHLSASCSMKLFNGNGAGKNYFDILTIPELLCFYNLTIMASDSIKIDNHASAGVFKYSLTLDVGSALINTTNSSLAEHEIFFANWNILELDRLFFENGCIFFVYWTAYCRICYKSADKFTFRFSDGFSLKIHGNRTVHAYGTITNSSDSQISAFHNVSQRLEIIFNIRSLDTNCSIMINHQSKTLQNKYVPVVLPSDPNNKRSLLIGGAVENIFLVNPTVNSSVTEITISVLNEHSLHNTIDLTSFVKGSVPYTVEKIAEDLIVTIHPATNQSEIGIHGIKVFLRIKKCFMNELYKTFTVILNSPMLIMIAVNDSVYLKPRPLVIDPSENPTMIIHKSQIEPSLEIHVIQEVLAWNTYRENKNLIWFAIGRNVDFFSIILQDFYTIDDQSFIDIKIKFDHNGVESDGLELAWNNTRPEKIQNLESIMKIFASNMK